MFLCSSDPTLNSGVCPDWVEFASTGFGLPPLEISEAHQIGASILLLWVTAFVIGVIVKMLKN